MNAINVIAPYRYLDMWVFDDPRAGLVAEPFVAGADTMIARVVADIPDAGKGFVMVFSQFPFPATSSGSNGCMRRTAATFITQRSLAWKAGFARRCSNILKRRRRSGSCR